jgi:pyruvate dehydrogenase E2 component (dihydrolipoamide acetyltransferase)
MAFEVVLPRLGWNMETGQLGEWLKKAGEYVEAGEMLFTVEGDKATQEVEALESGILFVPPDSPPPGEEVPVGTLLAYLLAEGETAPSGAADPGQAPGEMLEKSRSQPAGRADDTATDNDAFQSRMRSPGETPTISPRARRVADELGVDWTGLEGSGRTGRIVERDVRQAAAAAESAPAAGGERVSPLAQRLAAELGVDAQALAARTPGRRITRADIEAERLVAEPAKMERETAQVDAVSPISSVRRIIADRMATSAHTTAAVTLTTEADATELVKLRNQLKSDPTQPAPSYNDLFAKLTSQALLEYPAVNSRFDGDSIVQSAAVNVGIAADTERGLLVPVLRDVANKSLRQIARESASLIEAVRTGRATADDLQGGTFTITNLGMYEIDAFTPIINVPECAILGLGRILAKQVVVDAEAERLAIRHMMFLSLTFDHRLVDGAPAARFLQRVKQYIEKPYLWLVE